MLKILVVDDDAQVRASLERLLTRAGHTVCWSATGSGALALMRSERPDVVLLDMILAGDMNGWEVADQKRRDPEIAGIPTIILSGMDAKTIRLRGTIEYSALSEIQLLVTKPWNNERLLRLISWLETRPAECA